MGRSRAILHLEPQPGAQVYPELQLQGNGHKAQIIVILIFVPGRDTVPVERCAPGRLISTRSSVSYNSWGSAQLRRRTSCVGDRGTMRRPPSSSFMSPPAPMSPGMGSTSHIWYPSGNRGAVDTPAANQGPLGRTFTPSKDLRAHCCCLHPPQH